MRAARGRGMRLPEECEPTADSEELTEEMAMKEFTAAFCMMQQDGELEKASAEDTSGQNNLNWIKHFWTAFS